MAFADAAAISCVRPAARSSASSRRCSADGPPPPRHRRPPASPAENARHPAGDRRGTADPRTRAPPTRAAQAPRHDRPQPRTPAPPPDQTQTHAGTNDRIACTEPGDGGSELTTALHYPRLDSTHQASTIPRPIRPSPNTREGHRNFAAPRARQLQAGPRHRGPRCQGSLAPWDAPRDPTGLAPRDGRPRWETLGIEPFCYFNRTTTTLGGDARREGRHCPGAQELVRRGRALPDLLPLAPAARARSRAPEIRPCRRRRCSRHRDPGRPPPVDPVALPDHFRRASESDLQEPRPPLHPAEAESGVSDLGVPFSITVMSRAGSMRVESAHITSFQLRASISASTTITHFVYMNCRR